MDFPIHIDEISIGLPIVYFKGSQIELEFSKSCFCDPEGCFDLKQMVQTLMKGSIILHFIWVFTACQSTHLGVSSIQKGK